MSRVEVDYFAIIQVYSESLDFSKTHLCKNASTIVPLKLYYISTLIRQCLSRESAELEKIPIRKAEDKKLML